MAYTVMATQVAGYVVLASDWNEIVNNFIEMVPDKFTADGEVAIGTGANALEVVAILDSSNRMKHEYGGMEFDASAITTGGTVVGQSSGVMGIETPMTQAQAEAGTDTQVRGITAQRVKQAFDANVAANNARISTGVYTGNGATSQGITGVGFTPKYVKIWQRLTGGDGEDFGAGGRVQETTTTIVDDLTAGAAIAIVSTSDGLEQLSNTIISLDSDGFTVDDDGADQPPNQNTVVYNYLAIG